MKKKRMKMKTAEILPMNSINKYGKIITKIMAVYNRHNSRLQHMFPILSACVSQVSTRLYFYTLYYTRLLCVESRINCNSLCRMIKNIE